MRRKAMETRGDTCDQEPLTPVANGRCAERQWRLGNRYVYLGVYLGSPTGDAPKGNGDKFPVDVEFGCVSQVANGRCAERQWRLGIRADRVERWFLSPTGDAPKGNGDND